ncbi:MAG: hypothetical protein R6U57_12590 [Anaerolineales bacterium]
MTGNAAEKKGFFSGLLWIVLLTVPLYFLLRWFIKWMLLPSYKRISSVEIETPRSMIDYKALQEDDLTKIKGVGAKMNQALRAAGIRTYRRLAVAEDSELKRILKAANATIVDPSTWQEQARLAAQGAWEELEAFQREI